MPWLSNDHIDVQLLFWCFSNVRIFQLYGTVTNYLHIYRLYSARQTTYNIYLKSYVVNVFVNVSTVTADEFFLIIFLGHFITGSESHVLCGSKPAWNVCHLGTASRVDREGSGDYERAEFHAALREGPH